MPASSIGAYTFISMSDQPLTAGQNLQPESKAGVDGIGWWKTGTKGWEYQVTTIRDVDTFANAVALQASYQGLRNSGALAITYGGVAIGNVIVLDVKAKAERIVKGSGGLATTSQAIVRAQWRLIAV